MHQQVRATNLTACYFAYILYLSLHSLSVQECAMYEMHFSLSPDTVHLAYWHEVAWEVEADQQENESVSSRRLRDPSKLNV